MKTLKYANGDLMPILGLGTFRSEPGEIGPIIRKAVEIGYRHFDCAAVYGNEKEIGEALADAFKAGDVEREDLWITSKLWNDSHLKDDVRPALEKTLSDLRVDYLDLYLVHWPVAQKQGVRMPQAPEDFLTLDQAPLEETWEGMEDTVDDKLVKHIGVSNANINVLKLIIDSAWIPPEMNQVEMHPFLPQFSLHDYCRENDLLMTAYGPLGAPYRKSSDGKPHPMLMEAGTVKEVAEKHNCSTAQVLIAWSIARGIAVIPKTVNEKRLQENFDAANTKLDREDMRKMSMLPKHRYVNGEFFTIQGSPYKLTDLWEY